MAKTLLELAGAPNTPTSLSKGVLILIDAQNEYFEGPLKLTGVEAANDVIVTLLTRARAAGTPVVHIRHKGKVGGAFDLDAPRGQIHEALTPVDGETVIDKPLPNAFAGTNLADVVKGFTDRTPIIAGYQTHMCVSATTRAALDLGYLSTVVLDGVATRDLPDPVNGGVIAATDLNASALAGLADRFAILARASDIPD